MQTETASFRDPAGYVFYKHGLVFRQINKEHIAHYEHLMNCGLYEALIKEGLIIPHQVVQTDPLIIQPEKLAFVSYPQEWSFSQLKDAALATLKIQKIALDYGMSLKDASAYNIQFHNGRPILIDTLSLIPNVDALPWKAYKQFCQHFLAPLALEAYIDWRLKDLFLSYMDGIPLDLVVKLLPKKRFVKPGLLIHLLLHSKFQSHQKDNQVKKPSSQQSKLAAAGLISSLESTIRSISWKKPKTIWEDYYQDDSYTPAGFAHKEKIIESLLSNLQPNSVWDFGCNDGHYSLIAAKFSKSVISFDTDPICIERLYLKKSGILPLLMNLANPTPSFGWAEEERKGLSKRGPVDLVMALAVMHHLHISCGIPLGKMAEYLQSLCIHLIIEFIPKDDKKFKHMIVIREEDFQQYNEELFLSEFLKFFHLMNRIEINDSKRVLFLFKSKEV